MAAELLKINNYRKNNATSDSYGTPRSAVDCHRKMRTAEDWARFSRPVRGVVAANRHFS